jgi:hypothetical protein
MSDPIATMAIEVARDISAQFVGIAASEELGRLLTALERIRALAWDLNDGANDADDEDLRPRMTDLGEAVENAYKDLQLIRDSGVLQSSL